jgi:hypothetical protein
MNERQWELYRLTAVEEWPESPYKRAVSAAIEHKLMILDRDSAAREKAKREPSAVDVRSRTGREAQP